MNDLPFLLTSRDAACFPSADDPAKFHYLPTGPVPEQNPEGRFALGLMKMGRRVLFNLGALWHPSRAALEGLKDELASAHRELTRDAIRLVPANTRVDAMVLSLRGGGTGAGDLELSARTLGAPPYTTMFSAQLDEAQAERVREALEKRTRGVLLLTVRYRLRVDVSVTSRLAGDVGGDVARLSPEATEQDILRRLDEALSAGRLHKTREARPACIPHHLDADADSLALTNAVRMVKARLTQRPRLRSLPLTAEASLSEPMEFPASGPEAWLESTTDLADWAGSVSFRP